MVARSKPVVPWSERSLARRVLTEGALRDSVPTEAGVIARQTDILWVSRIAAVVATKASGAGHEERRFAGYAPRYLAAIESMHASRPE